MHLPNRNESCEVTDTLLELCNTCTIRQGVLNHLIEFTCSAIVSPNMRDFGNLDLWPFLGAIFNFFVEELV